MNLILTGVGWSFLAVWWLLTLPFRLVFGAVSLLGRLAGLAIGFALMVLGAALSAGPLLPLGALVFLVGLVLTLRSLG